MAEALLFCSPFNCQEFPKPGGKLENRQDLPCLGTWRARFLPAILCQPLGAKYFGPFQALNHPAGLVTGAAELHLVPPIEMTAAASIPQELTPLLLLEGLMTSISRGVCGAWGGGLQLKGLEMGCGVFNPKEKPPKDSWRDGVAGLALPD